MVTCDVKLNIPKGSIFSVLGTATVKSMILINFTSCTGTGDSVPCSEHKTQLLYFVLADSLHYHEASCILVSICRSLIFEYVKKIFEIFKKLLLPI